MWTHPNAAQASHQNNSDGGVPTIECGHLAVQVRFWALDTLRCVRKCEGHEDAVRVLAVADGRVFSGSYDGSIGVWN